MLSPIKVTHLTSVHPRNDTRIFIKECCSLVNNGYDVNLVVADGLDYDKCNGVKIFDVGRLSGRIRRMINTTEAVFKKAVELNSEIYHFHDPELLAVGLKLKKNGKTVIYDVHEDVPRQIMGKPYIHKLFKPLISRFIEIYENRAARKFDAIITATPYIRNRFLKINKNTMDINNYPIIEELKNEINWDLKKNEICYIGGIGEIRGIKEIVRSMEYVKNDIRLNLGGRFSEKKVEIEVKKYKGWSSVNELGFLDRSKVKDILSKSKAGLVTLHPVTNYIDALPVKMFEYMISGIPVIASDFPLLREIIGENNCGLCVNPLDPKDIANAIDYIINNPLEAEQMAENGQKAVIEKYNWRLEEKKLINLYERLVK